MGAETAGLKVVSLYDKAMAGDVIGSLRRAADTIESETADDDRTVGMVAVQLGERGSVQVYGWGQVDKLRAIGLLHAGIAEVLS